MECSSVTLQLPSTLTVFNIYRQPTSSKYSQPISIFLDEFQTFLSSAATTSHEFIITGDFNIHVDDHFDSFSQQFTYLLSSTNLTQHVSVSTRIHNHTLDLVITSSHTNLSSTISQTFITVSDQFPIFTHLNLKLTPPPPPSNITFCHTTNINIVKFNNNLASFNLNIHHPRPPASLPELLDCYDSTLRSIPGKHASLVTKL